MFYRKVFFTKTARFWRYDFLYTEEIEYKQTKTLIGPALGFTYTTDRKGINFEYGASLGLGNYKVVNEGIPEDAEEDEFNFFNFYNRDGNYAFLIISAHFKLRFGR